MVSTSPEQKNNKEKFSIPDILVSLFEKVSGDSIDPIYSILSKKVEKAIDFIIENKEVNEGYLKLLNKTEAKLDVLKTKIDSLWWENRENETYEKLISTIDYLMKKIRKEKTETTLRLAGPEYVEIWEIINSHEDYNAIQDIIIEDTRDDDFEMASFDPNFSNPEEGPKVLVPIESSDDYIREVMNARKELLQIVKERLQSKGVGVEDLNPDFLQLFIFLHELGHAHDYLTSEKFLDKDGNLDELKYKTTWNKELGSLPLPYIRPVQFVEMIKRFGWDKEGVWSPESFNDLLKKLSSSDKIYKGNYEKLSAKDAKSPEEILAIIEREYKSLKSEKAADDFATNFIARHFQNKED